MTSINQIEAAQLMVPVPIIGWFTNQNSPPLFNCYYYDRPAAAPLEGATPSQTGGAAKKAVRRPKSLKSPKRPKRKAVSQPQARPFIRRPVRKHLRPPTFDLPENYLTSFKAWFILPGSGQVYGELSANTRSLKSAFAHIYICKSIYDNYAPAFKSSAPQSVNHRSSYIFYNPAIIRMIRSLIFKNQRVRHLFKRCIQRWRCSKLKQINTEDPATLAAPVKPVMVYDWPNRSKYVFEGSTLLRDICCRLLNSTGILCKSVYPRNMFTNMEFSVEQMHFITRDLMDVGQSNLILNAFAKSNFCLETFASRYSIIIKQEIIEKIFKQWSSLECVDLVFDFFELWKEVYDVTTANSAMWEWAFENLNEGYPLVKSWRRLAQEYYIKYVSEPEHIFKATRTALGLKAHDLLKRGSYNIYAAWLKPLINADIQSLTLGTIQPDTAVYIVLT